jgi:hypothetical protein
MQNTDKPDIDDIYTEGPLAGLNRNVGDGVGNGQDDLGNMKEISYNPEALAICHAKGWCSET